MGLATRAHGRATLALSATTLVLAVPGVAQAATTGSDLIGTSTPIGCAENATCILSQDELGGDVFNNVVSEDGAINGFSFRHVTGDVAFIVLRQTGASSYALVDRTNYVTGSGDDETESYELDSPIPVRRGDFIGLALDTGATVGARTAGGGEDTNLLELSDADPPVLAASDRASELFLQASWDPTSTDDGSGFDGGGDDAGDSSTAVPDPLAALKAGQRPKVSLSGKAARASKKYSVRITVRNPNGYGVKGKLSLKSKGLKLGAKSFAIAPESSTSVRVKLSAKARSRLARRRKLKATVSATFRGPIGKAGSSRKSITIKAPKRPKKRRVQNRGGSGGGGGLLRPPLCLPHIEYDADGWAHAIPC